MQGAWRRGTKLYSASSFCEDPHARSPGKVLCRSRCAQSLCKATCKISIREGSDPCKVPRGLPKTSSKLIKHCAWHMDAQVPMSASRLQRWGCASFLVDKHLCCKTTHGQPPLHRHLYTATSNTATLERSPAPRLFGLLPGIFFYVAGRLGVWSKNGVSRGYFDLLVFCLLDILQIRVFLPFFEF